jgi:hypothetical protein
VAEFTGRTAPGSAKLNGVAYVTADALSDALDHVRRSPADIGTVELLVCRPANGERGLLQEAVLDVDHGLLGDNWLTRGSRHTADGSADPDGQITLINARVIAAVAGDDAGPERRALAGDQLHLDLDLSEANLPPGTRLAVGEAVIEVTAKPHLGCAKFIDRFGLEATRFLNSMQGRGLRLRGANAKVVSTGRVRAGDVVRKLPAD